jgi:hypothetical protein
LLPMFPACAQLATFRGLFSSEGRDACPFAFDLPVSTA